jgi:hypothetical protein
VAFPQQIKGSIFTEVLPQLTPEVSSESLVKLGSIVQQKSTLAKYEHLIDSLRKIQWVKINGSRAVFLEEEFAKQIEKGALLMAQPNILIEHRLNITDCVIHTKSALDSMAVFLTDFFELEAREGARDLKKFRFRGNITDKDPKLGKLIRMLEPWLIELQKIRDEWIHIRSVRTVILQGPSEIGVFPIPKDVTLELKAFDLPRTKQNFWTTKEFVEHHYLNAVKLFQGIVDRCIELDEKTLGTPVQVAEGEKNLFFWPIFVNEDMTVNKMKIYSGEGKS